MKTLFEINPGLDRPALAQRFADSGRVQVRDVLTAEAAAELAELLRSHTPWSMAVHSAVDGAAQSKSFRNHELRNASGIEAVNRAAASAEALSARGEYAFRYAHYPIVDALNGQWDHPIAPPLCICPSKAAPPEGGPRPIRMQRIARRVSSCEPARRREGGFRWFSG